MYQLITKKGQVYWLSKAEVIEIRKLLQKGVTFITLQRYDKTINTFDIHEITVPDWAYPILRNGERITFLNGRPHVLRKDHYLVLEEGDKWESYDGKIQEKNLANFKSFEDFIGEVKRLN